MQTVQRPQQQPRRSTLLTLTALANAAMQRGDWDSAAETEERRILLEHRLALLADAIADHGADPAAQGLVPPTP